MMLMMPPSSVPSASFVGQQQGAGTGFAPMATTGNTTTGVIQPPTPKRIAHKTKLPSSFEPGPYTVICGRGKLCTESPGNVYLRGLVKDFLEPYSQAQNKKAKSKIVSSIITMVREQNGRTDDHLEDGVSGAFVKQSDATADDASSSSTSDDCTKEWWEVDESFAREKIGCMFRDLLHTQYRSSTKAKHARSKKDGSTEKKKSQRGKKPTAVVHKKKKNDMKAAVIKNTKTSGFLPPSFQQLPYPPVPSPSLASCCSSALSTSMKMMMQRNEERLQQQQELLQRQEKMLQEGRQHQRLSSMRTGPTTRLSNPSSSNMTFRGTSFSNQSQDVLHSSAADDCVAASPKSLSLIQEACHIISDYDINNHRHNDDGDYRTVEAESTIMDDIIDDNFIDLPDSNLSSIFDC